MSRTWVVTGGQVGPARRPLDPGPRHPLLMELDEPVMDRRLALDVFEVELHDQVVGGFPSLVVGVMAVAKRELAASGEVGSFFQFADASACAGRTSVSLTRSGGGAVSDLAATIVHQRERLNEIARVGVRYGFADWVERSGAGAPGSLIDRISAHVVDPDLVLLSQAERLRGALVELGTTWIKFGQMLSLRPDLVGADIADELAKLQADVPPDPPGDAQATIETDLGASIDELYAAFDATPFASGSVAQVHRAELTSGEVVAVKVLHTGAAEKVRSDLELMSALAVQVETHDPEFAQYRPTVLVSEFADMMLSAIDLGQELRNLQLFAANFKDEPDVVMPTAYPDRSRPRVLTMSLLEGTPFADRTTVESTGWDVDQLVNRATDVYLEMIFRDGVYHADPHRGNFLLPDGHHFAILDFGDVGRVSQRRRDQLESLVIAVGTHDLDGMTAVIIDMTAPPSGTDMAKLRDDIETWLNRYLLVGVGHLDIAAITNSGMQMMHSHHLVLPADLALLFRVLLRLQGLGRAVGTDVRVTELLEPYVRKMMAERFNPSRVAHNALRTVRDWEHLIAALPDDVHAVLDQLRKGDLRVDFQIHDADGAVDHLVDGLMAASSTLASAQLLSRRTGPTVGGMSLPGLAAVAVSAITWRRLLIKRAGHRSLASRARSLSPRTA
jgi:ubiquinone biosynthesis protein